MTSILKKEGVEIMGEHMLPNPPFPGGHNTAFTPPAQELTDQVIQATKEAQRDAFTIEDDAIAQLEAADRFEYTVDELVDLVARLRADCECYRDLLDSDRLTKSVRALLVERGYTCLMELKRLQAGMVVV